MTVKLAITITIIAMTCGLTVGFVAGYFFHKGPDQ